MNTERLRKREWIGTMLGAGLVLAVAVVLDSQPAGASRLPLILACLCGSFLATAVIVVAVRTFSGKPSIESVRLHQEVHP